ncbi:hypothetical protein M413DRAFT_422474 [Hebeloma cylindrosporum]|uniref:RRM domain-containing protein n=1 Tax=Hebeloma cylindrosporum TaxID=76867 RepID=A0A0C3CS94_HEBCY|nr:hypothetical protein M413DRAFT_422474 [Hebeloma cylindrosporum h7]
MPICTSAFSNNKLPLVHKREIVALFNTLIGQVRNFQDVRDGPSPRLDITFLDRDAATKALCMNGYRIDGTSLSVSALTAPSSRFDKNGADDRRNLYVLGLPFALTKNEFTAIFSQYGAVSHCVILATVDNSSRRRGFVVMSTHDEARHAMACLTRTLIKGHSIDVSWAVVQRSQGFLDGGDRAMLLDSRSPARSPSPSPILHGKRRLTSSDSSDSSLDSHEADPASLATSSVPSTSLLVTNLPTLLFSQAQDLHPLFFPFGHIEKLEIVQVSPLGTMSVVVQYSQATIAQEAKESLSGQRYGSYQVEARYVKPATPLILELDQRNASGLIDNRNLVKNALDPSGRARTSEPLRLPSDHKIDPPLEYFATSVTGRARYNSFPDFHSRSSSLSAPYLPFSNVFDDPPRPASTSTGLRLFFFIAHIKLFLR